MTNRDQIDKEAIEKYLNGQSSIEDMNIISKWLEADPHNRDTFNTIKAEWVNSLTSNSDISENRLIGRKILHKYNRKNRWAKIRPIAIGVAKIAAIVIITLTIFESKLLFKQDETLCKVTTPSGEKSMVTLPDGSKVWLNAESEISFPSDFKSNRNVTLTGEAFFDVEKGDNQFKVSTADYDVVVHGTKFNVMSYPDFGYTETSLLEGSVNIIYNNKIFSLKPGEQMRFQSGNLSKKISDMEAISAWKDNKFYFKSIPFKELIRRLEMWYDVDIKTSDSSLDKIKFSGAFKNKETVWQVLDGLSLTLPIEFSIESHRVINISKKRTITKR